MEKIGLIGATAIGLGAIIGAGIFVLSGVSISLAGSGAILAFLLTGVTALMAAFQISELASRMPHRRGSTYSFAYKAFGSELGFTSGMLGLLSLLASVSAIAMGFGSYAGSLSGMNSTVDQFAFSIAIVLVLSVIAYKGVRAAARTDTVLVSFKVLALIIFIIFGLYAGKAAGFTVSNVLGNGWGGIFSAAVIAMFAYSGFGSIIALTPYMKGGGKTAAKAVILAAILSIIIYIGVVITLLHMAPQSAYGVSGDPLTIALSASGAPSWLYLLIGIAALVATASATLAMLVSSNMLMYQMSLDGLLPSFFRKPANPSGAQRNSLLVVIALGVGLMFTGSIYIIAAISNFGTIFSYLINSMAIIKIRRLENSGKHGDILASMKLSTEGIFKTPLYPYIPIVVIILTILFVFGMPSEALLGGVLTILLGLLIYYTMRELRDKPIIRIRLFR